MKHWNIIKDLIKKEEAACYNNLGLAYNNLGDSFQAIEFYNKSLAIKKRPVIKSESLNLGLILYKQDRKRAKEEAEEAERLLQELKLENFPFGEEMMKFIKEIYEEKVTEETKREFSFLSEKFLRR
uniref:Tetratricopeptide repeat protein n=1 Tax=candidate division WOR-3 bacterium TaxID=2052148 RepID=A0A7C3YSV0_UNCW3